MSNDNSIKLANGVELPPLRGLDDFLFDRARFEAPPFSELPRWNNRIISNLLYYQTNYFSFVLLFFVLQSFFNAKDLALGLSAVIVLGSVIVLSTYSHGQIYQWRREHPLVTLGVLVLAVYYTISVLPSVLVLLFTLLMPVFLCLVHASVRLRGFMNKVTQATEKLGLRTTVMGRLLNACNISVKA